MAVVRVLLFKMSIEYADITQELNISNATLQNWLKTDCLRLDKNGFINTESYEYFKKNILGKDKLNKRANKQHFNQSSGTSFVLNKNDDANKSSDQYEQSLSIATKNKQGIYYTPDSVIDAMFAALPTIKATDTFLDPCCGTGNFLLKALEKGFKPENIYGFDVDDIALEIANTRFLQTTSQTSDNIKSINLLETNHDKKYNFIFTNPPWGYKFSTQQKITYANKFNQGIKLDSSALFVLVCLDMMQKNGLLGVLLPDAFFNISTFKSARAALLKKTLIRLINHNKPFEGLQTKAYSFVVKNGKNLADVTCQTQISQHTREQIDFINNPNHIINFDANNAEAKVISHLYSYPHQTLSHKAKWGLGIVTGNNAKHLSPIKKDDYQAIYKGRDVEKAGFKKAQFYISDDFSKLQQTANKKLYLADEKVVYRFINTNLVFALDCKQRYFLNSANFLILNKSTLFDEDKLTITPKQLVFLMNSEIMNWLFKKIFNTHKILRSDLEKLPIFNIFFQTYDNYCEQDLNQYLNIEKHDGTFRIKA